MKRLGLIVLLLFWAFHAISCVYSSVKIWPVPGTVLPSNPVFVITVYGEGFKKEIIENRFMYLVSGSDTVKLELVDSFVGVYAHYQALVRVHKLLAMGTIYTAAFNKTYTPSQLSALYKDFPIDSLNYINDKWQVSKNASPNELPTPKIKFAGNYYAAPFTSCQNLAAKFSYASKATDVVYKLTLWEKDIIKQQFFIKPHNDSLLHIYSDMFNIRAFKKYKVSLELMNVSGDVSASSEKITYHAPVLKAVLMRIAYFWSDLL